MRQGGTTPAAAGTENEIDDIELMMTPTQLHAIADLQITPESARGILAGLAFTPGAESSSGNLDTVQLASAVIQYLRQRAAA